MSHDFGTGSYLNRLYLPHHRKRSDEIEFVSFKLCSVRMKGQFMRRIVEDLIRVDGVIGSLLVGKDGLVVASTLLDEEDAEILGAMSAAVFGEIDKATKRIGVGTLVDSIIDAKDGSILLLEAKELILVVITQRTVNLGLVKMEMRRAAKRISEAVPI